MKDLDRSALSSFKPSENIYLKVVGEGTTKHLEARRVGFLGRIWIWIQGNSSNFSACKVAQYVRNNKSLMQVTTYRELRLLAKLGNHLERKKDGLDRYDYCDAYTRFWVGMALIDLNSTISALVEKMDRDFEDVRKLNRFIENAYKGYYPELRYLSEKKLAEGKRNMLIMANPLIQSPALQKECEKTRTKVNQLFKDLAEVKRA